MHLLAVSGIIAGLVTLAAYVPYTRDIFKGTTRPVRATWFIWSILSCIALVSQIASGGTWSVVMTGAQSLGTFTIFGLSIRRGYGGLGKKEIISLIVAALGLLFWALTSQPLLALLAVVIVDLAGSWLTIIKAYADPGSETLSTWILDCVSSVFALIAIGSLDYALILYPAYLLIANGAVVVAIYAARSRVHLLKVK